MSRAAAVGDGKERAQLLRGSLGNAFLVFVFACVGGFCNCICKTSVINENVKIHLQYQ